MSKYRCENGCCMLEINPYNPNPFQRTVRKGKKAGVFIYDPDTDKVLLVQSRGQLWGPPKGTREKNESDRVCAVREVKEETGLDVDEKKFSKAVIINNRAIYYYLEHPYCDVHVQDHVYNNDANGIGWIKMDCLEKCVRNGNIVLSKHSARVFQRFRNRVFPTPRQPLVIGCS